MKRIGIIVCIIFFAALTSGCATTSATTHGSAKAGESDTDFYNGEPEVVFATEFPVASAEEAIARADQALDKGDTDLALYMYVRAYDLDRDNVHALMRIGEIHASRGDNKLATVAFSSVLRVDPTNAAALQSLGLIYLKGGKHDEAKALLRRAVAEDPSLWRAQNGLGVIADLEEEHDTAISAYNAALAANPGDASLLNNRGYSLYLDGKYAEAAQDLSTAAALGAKRAWLNLGLVRARQKQYPEALEMMTRTVASEVAYNDVGYIAMRQGDLDVAKSYFKKAIEISPRYFEAAQRNLDQLRSRAADAQTAVRVEVSNETG